MASSSANGQDAQMKEIGAQVDALKNDISALTKAVSDMGVAKTKEFKHAAYDQAEQLRERGEAVMADAGARARAAGHTVEQQVQQNPAAALGIATGVGFLLGLIFARK